MFPLDKANQIISRDQMRNQNQSGLNLVVTFP